MPRIAAVIASLVLLASCATAPEVPSLAKFDLAPSGTLRVGINFGNVLLTGKDPKTGAPRGVAVDLAHELARRLGVPIEIVPFDSAGAMADAVKTGKWDVAFLGAEPQRANEIAFTAAYAEIESTYLVPAGSPLRTIADVDRPGVRIAVASKSAYELYLSRTLKHAQLVRVPGVNAYETFLAQKLDALAGLRPVLLTDSEKLPGSRVLEGRFSTVQQAIGTPKAREAAAKYLREFAEDVKASGFVARSIEKNAVRGLAVAPAAVTK
ncbi:MAG TPA: ABC transporter substrate-binding protein [Burkholderiales bacterium]|nr:ABC transporter substrate-binding protein [Burkholderiales bacterium]